LRQKKNDELCKKYGKIFQIKFEHSENGIIETIDSLLKIQIITEIEVYQNK
jgi:hypothetical protein